MKQKIELHIFLNSPYKWGQGWTASAEEHETMKNNSWKIIDAIGHKRVINDYGVPEGIAANGNKSYLHPMTFTISVEENEIDKVIEIVKSHTLPMYRITEIKTRTSDAEDTDRNVVWLVK